MKKILFIFSGWISLCFAQTNYILKKPLSNEDIAFIKSELKDEMFPGIAWRIEYMPADFEKGLQGKDKIFDAEEEKALKAKLTGGKGDAEIYYALMVGYNSLFQNVEALRYLDKSVEACNRVLDEEPNDVQANVLMAQLQTFMKKTKEADFFLRKALKTDPHNREAKMWYAALPIYERNMTEALARIKANIAAAPDSAWNYRLLPVYYLVKIIGEGDTISDRAKKLAFVQNKPAEAIADLSLIKTAYEKNQNEEAFETIYKLSELCVLVSKAYLLSALDTNISPHNTIYFNTEKKDVAALKKLLSYFEKHAKDETSENRYLHYKSAAIINVFLNDYGKAKMYFEKCLQVKLNQRSTLMNNASYEYDAIAGTTLLLSDTLGTLKILLDKINHPASIRPEAGDYITIARIYFTYGMVREGTNFLSRAEKYYSRCADLNLVKAIEAIRNDELGKAQVFLENEMKNSEDKTSLNNVIALFSLLTNHPDNAYDWFVEVKNKSRNPEKVQKNFIDRFLMPVKK